MRRVLLLTATLAFVLVPSVTRSSPYDDYKALNPTERRLALRYFWQLSGVKAAADFARDESARTFPALAGQDDPRDAFRHSMWNGGMVSRLGSREAAERWATAHEADPANPAARRAMDLFNNDRGRELAWALRTTNGPWWRRTRLPDDAGVRARMHDALRTGELRVIEEVLGQRDPQSGRLVPSYVP